MERFYVPRADIENEFWKDFNQYNDKIRVFNFFGSYGIGKSYLMQHLSQSLSEMFVINIRLNETTNVYSILEMIRNRTADEYGLKFPLFDYVEQVYLKRINRDHKKESRNSVVEFFGQVVGVKIPLGDFIIKSIYEISKYHKKLNLEKAFSQLTKLEKEYTLDEIENIMLDMFGNDMSAIRNAHKEKRFIIILEDYEDAFDYIFKAIKGDGWLVNKYNGLISKLGQCEWLITSINEVKFNYEYHSYAIKPFNRDELDMYLVKSGLIGEDVVVPEMFMNKLITYTGCLPRNVYLLVDILISDENKALSEDILDKYKNSQIYLEEFINRFTHEENQVLSVFICLGEWFSYSLNNVIKKVNKIITIDEKSIRIVEDKLFKSGYLHINGSKFSLESHFIGTMLPKCDPKINEAMFSFYEDVNKNLMLLILTAQQDELSKNTHLLNSVMKSIYELSEFAFIKNNLEIVHDLILSTDLIGSYLEDAKIDLNVAYYELAYKLSVDSLYIHNSEQTLNDIRNCTKVLARVYKKINKQEAKRYNLIYIEYSLLLLEIDCMSMRLEDTYGLVEKDLFRFIYYMLEIGVKDQEMQELNINHYDRYIELVLSYIVSKNNVHLLYRYMVTRLKTGCLFEMFDRKTLAYEEYYLVASKTGIVDFNDQSINEIDELLNMYSIYRLHQVIDFEEIQNKGGEKFIDKSKIIKIYNEKVNCSEFTNVKNSIENTLNNFEMTNIANNFNWFLDKFNEKVHEDIQTFNRDDIFHINFKKIG